MVSGQESEIGRQESVIKDQWSRFMIRGHWSDVTGQRSLVRVKDQWSKVTGQWSRVMIKVQGIEGLG